MAVPGNVELTYLALQSAKGTPAAAPTMVLRHSGGGLRPQREQIPLPESDSSTQEPDDNVVGIAPQGTIEGWVRLSEIDLLLQGVLGAVANSGSNPNYVHTLTPAVALPYLTAWSVIPGVSCWRFDDVRIGSLGLQGQAGGGISYRATLNPLSYTFDTEPVVPAAFASDAKLTYPQVAVTIGGSHPGTVDQWELLIQRNIGRLRGDSGLADFDSSVALMQISGSMQKVYTDDDDERAQFTGTTGGSTPTVTIFEETLNIAITENANRLVDFDSNAIQYREYTRPINTDGTPLLVTRTFRTKRQTAVADNLTSTVKNGKATPAAVPA